MARGQSPRRPLTPTLPWPRHAAQLVGKSVVLVANLKPRKMRGIQSHGMVVAGAFSQPAADGVDAAPVSRVVLLDSAGLPPGTPLF